ASFDGEEARADRGVALAWTVLRIGVHPTGMVETNVAAREDASTGEIAGTWGILESATPSMRRAVDTARRAAAFDAVILLTGESGTGKNVLASAIHAWSTRRGGPFVTVRCGALDHLHGGALRGPVWGPAQTAGRHAPDLFKAARGGTLFLDEVGDLTHEAQGVLLHRLTGQGFERIGDADLPGPDVRVVAATRRDLESEVSAGRFRDDLYFRLNVVTIALPPWRDPCAALAALPARVRAGLAACYGRGTIRSWPDPRQVLARYDWPGNHRELVNVLERAVILSPGDTIAPEHLPDRLLARPPCAS